MEIVIYVANYLIFQKHSVKFDNLKDMTNFAKYVVDAHGKEVVVLKEIGIIESLDYGGLREKSRETNIFKSC